MSKASSINTRKSKSWLDAVPSVLLGFTSICSICGFIVAYHYETHLGEFLVTSHSLEDYLRITFSARNIEAVIYSILYASAWGLLIVICWFIVSFYMKQKAKIANYSAALEVAHNVLYQWHKAIFSLIFLCLVTSSFWNSVNKQMQLKFSLIEKGLSPILRVETKDFKSIDCLSHIKEINGFTYFYSFEEDEIITIATNQIFKIDKDPKFTDIPSRFYPSSRLSRTTRIWNDAIKTGSITEVPDYSQVIDKLRSENLKLSKDLVTQSEESEEKRKKEIQAISESLKKTFEDWDDDTIFDTSSQVTISVALACAIKL